MKAPEFVVKGSVQLRRGSLMRIAGARDVTLYVCRGTVWITQEGDREDHFVGAGGSFRVGNDGLALASALEPSVISLTAPRPLQAPA